MIAVTSRLVAKGKVERWLEPALAGPTYYLEAISRAGGVGAQVLPEPIDQPTAAALMARFDGLVLTGGPDVDPSLYGQEAAPETYDTDVMIDRFELALLDAALDGGQARAGHLQGPPVAERGFRWRPRPTHHRP